MLNHVVFIMGRGHSGSTLLDLLLGSHSESFSLGELRMLAKPGKTASVCGICSDSCPFWDEKVSRRVLAYHFSSRGPLARLRHRAAPFTHSLHGHLLAASGKRVVVDSSKQRVWIRQRLRPFHHWRTTRPFLIHLVRDGRAVANSFLRQFPDTDMAEFARKWKEVTLADMAFFDAFDPAAKLRIHYEELATDPAAVMEELCRRLELPFEHEMLRYWTHEHHLVRGNLGTRSLILRQREQFSVTPSAWESQHDMQPFSEAYYQQVGLAIKLDQRWRHELSEEHVATFEAIAGAVNEPLAYG
jgi:hypothetical protein